MIRFYYDRICKREIIFGFCGFGCGLLGESFLVKDVTLNRLIKKRKKDPALSILSGMPFPLYQHVSLYFPWGCNWVSFPVQLGVCLTTIQMACGGRVGPGGEL